MTWIWDRDFVPQDPTASRFKVEVIGEAFFTYLRDNLDSDPTLGRIFEGIDVVITGGGRGIVHFY